jgi:hypothetical protein
MAISSREVSGMQTVLRLLVILSVVLLTAATQAGASTIWNWQLSGSGIAASGTFTTLDSPDTTGGYLITGITGTRNGINITRLQAPGTAIPGNEPYSVDDLVYLAPKAQLTSSGFGFALADGTYSNPFYADFLPTPGYLEFYSTPPEHTELSIAFSAAPVATPEPGSAGLALLAAGLLSGVLRWRRNFRS